MEFNLEQMIPMVDIIAEEKNLPKEVILDIIEQAIAAAWRRDNGDRDMNVRAELDLNTGKAKVYIIREVIEDGVGYNPATEIPQEESNGKEIGETVEEEHDVEEFGRVASQTAKQVIMQRLKDAERDAILNLFEDRIGTIATGTIARVEPRVVRIDLDKATGIMPRGEQIPGEHYLVGSRIKVYIKTIERGERGAALILSRSNAHFVEHLFRQEVPEVDSGTVEIRGIAREAGRRTKIAVSATIPGIDPVGTFVGGRGVRVQAVMNEIGDREKIDIINWSENASEYIREALGPAEIQRVEIDGKKAIVYVDKEQQSIAIGRSGQNVRLASELTGYDLTIEVAKAPEKKKRTNVEDSLLSALEESAEDEPTDTGADGNDGEDTGEEASSENE